MVSLTVIFSLLATYALAATTSSGNFYIPRNSTCRSISANSATTSQASKANCLTFTWDDYQKYSTSYTNITDQNGRNFSLYFATLGVAGSFSTNVSSSLSYTCPPDGYNGFI